MIFKVLRAYFKKWLRTFMKEEFEEIAELHYMLDFYKKILDTVPANIYLTDSQNRAVYANKNQLKDLGIENLEQIRNKPLSDLYPHDEARAIYEVNERAIREKSSVLVDEWLTVKGELRCYFSSKSFFNIPSKIHGSVGVSINITELKRQDSMRLNNARMEQALNAARNIAFNIAHELRTPLVALDAGLNTLNTIFEHVLADYRTLKEQAPTVITELELEDIEPIRLDFEVMKDEIKNSQMFIDMLIMNTRVQQFNESMIEPCSMKKCIERAIKRYPYAKKYEDAIVWDDTQDFIFFGDHLIMEHVLLNLIKNAIYAVIKANREDAKIYIRIENGEDVNTVFVKDTALGISSEIMEQIFDPFFSSSEGGAGLGLSFCRLAIERMSGRLLCDSQLGAYCEFSVQFPVATRFFNQPLPTLT